MRGLSLAVIFFACGCATTVQRLPGTVDTSVGEARGSCEAGDWLTLAPTRSRSAPSSGSTTTTRRDGIAAYRTGESSPEPIADLREPLGDSPMLERHAARTSRHDQKQLLSAGLGIAGLAALGVGSYLFATSFETRKTTRSDGTTSEKQEISGGRAAVAGIVVAAGFGLGISGIVVSPSSGERARADQERYVFLPPDDDPKEVARLVSRHNRAVRERCSRQSPAR